MPEIADGAVVREQLENGLTLFGSNWRCVENFDDVDDDYEEETEEYVVLDLGTSIDARTLQSESSYQLIGMDTSLPFLKIGDHIFQGTVTPLIGDEILFDVVRQAEAEEGESRPHHRPFIKTSHRVELRGITLYPRAAPLPQTLIRGDRPLGSIPGGVISPLGVRATTPLADQLKISGDIGRGMFPIRQSGRSPSIPGASSAPTPDGKGEDIEMQEDNTQSQAGPSRSSVSHSPPQPSTPLRLFDVEASPASVSRGAPPSVTLSSSNHHFTVASATSPSLRVNASLANIPKRGKGRPRGSTALRTSILVRTAADLDDIAAAGGLGDVRLEIATDAAPDLLDAIAAVLKRPIEPGTPPPKLTKAQENRLVRRLPAMGPGSRGGRRTEKGAGRGRRGRGRGQGGRVDVSGRGMADDFIGTEPNDEGGKSENENPTANQREDEDVEEGAGPDNRGEDNDDELREIDDLS